MRVVAVQQVTKQMQDGEFLTAIKTVVWVVNPKLHIGFTPFARTFLNFRGSELVERSLSCPVSRVSPVSARTMIKLAVVLRKNLLSRNRPQELLAIEGRP